MMRTIEWEPRHWASRMLRAVVFLVPLVAGVVAATALAGALPSYDTLWGGFLWWVAVLGASFVAINLVDRRSTNRDQNSRHADDREVWIKGVIAEDRSLKME